jgi:hypothetical protein
VSTFGFAAPPTTRQILGKARAPYHEYGAKSSSVLPPDSALPLPGSERGEAGARNRIRGPGLSVWGPTGAGGQSDDGNATGRRSQTPSGLRTRKLVELKPAVLTVLLSTRRARILVMTRMHGIMTGAVNRCAACVAWGSHRGRPSRAYVVARSRESSLPSTPFASAGKVSGQHATPCSSRLLPSLPCPQAPLTRERLQDRYYGT